MCPRNVSHSTHLQQYPKGTHKEFVLTALERIHRSEERKTSYEPSDDADGHFEYMCSGLRQLHTKPR